MKNLLLLGLAALLVAACGAGNNAPAAGNGANKAPATSNAADNSTAENPNNSQPELVAHVYELGIEGMTWGTGWVRAAEGALSSLDGVEKVKVSFMDKKATVTTKPGKEVTEDQAREAVKKGGDEQGNEFSLTSFKQVE